MESMHTFEHEGYQIEVRDNGLFYLNKGSDDGVNASSQYDSFSTLDEAKQAAHQLGLAERSSVSLDLPVLLEDGKEYIVRRIHSGHGSWLTTPPLPRYQNSICYRPSYSVRELLSAMIRLDKERERVSLALRVRAIDLRKVGFYGRNFDKAEAIEQRYRAFREAYDSMVDTEVGEAVHEQD